MGAEVLLIDLLRNVLQGWPVEVEAAGRLGFRSVSLIAITDNLQDNDVGSPIDALVRAQLLPSDDPISLYYPKLGQFWCFNGSTVWAYSFSRTAKISAWSEYTLPFTIDDATVLNQELYVRTGDDVAWYPSSRLFQRPVRPLTRV